MPMFCSVILFVTVFIFKHAATAEAFFMVAHLLARLRTMASLILSCSHQLTSRHAASRRYVCVSVSKQVLVARMLI